LAKSKVGAGYTSNWKNKKKKKRGGKKKDKERKKLKKGV